MSRLFGLEVRRTGNISSENLYKDVDTVLNKYNIPSKGVTKDLQIQAIAHSLQEMLQPNKHFSICTIDKCIKICKVHISAERYNIYSSMHCVNWRDMTEDFRMSLTAMILDDFREVLSYE